MEQKLDKIEFKDRLISIIKKNNKKIIIFFTIILIIIISTFILEIKNNNKNTIISEKYIQAGIQFTNNNKKKSKKLYEEIILSKNKFYSSLALNDILEKKLEVDDKKILNYFNIVERISHTKEKSDIIIFKKALYLMKNSNTGESKILLKNLIDKNSKLKLLAEELLEK